MSRNLRYLNRLPGWLVLLALAGLAAGAEPQGNLLQGVRIADQRGEELDLEALAQERLVLDFAASWCDPCYEALPRLQALAKDHPEIHFVVVSVDETEDGWNRLIRDLALELPVVWDRKQHLVESFSPEGFPATYVFEGGRLIHRHTGTGSAQWQQLTGILGREEGESRQPPA